MVRLALVYALLDGQAFIDEPHLSAALACWDYAEASARHVFGDALGDPVADEIMRALRDRPGGMPRNELTNHFGRNKSGEEIGRALGALQSGNFAAMTIESKGDRPAERWKTVR